MNLDRIDDPELTWLASLARALIGATDSSDLAQDALVAAIERPTPAGVPRRAWLAGITRRLAMRHVRARARRHERELDAARPSPPLAPDELLERAEVAAAVSAAVQRLPEPFRRTVLLRHLEGMEPREIAASEGVPVDTVRWRLRRGLALLRERLATERDDMVAFLLPLASRGGRAKAPAAVASLLSALPIAIMSKVLVITFASVAALLATLALAGGDGRSGESDPARSDAASSDRSARITAPDRTTSLTAPTIDAQRASRASSGGASSPTSVGEGVVVDASTGEPVPGARVAWLGEDGVVRSAGRVVTDGEGRFLLGLDEAGRRIGVTANGHRRRAFEVTGAERPWVITLDPGRVLRGRLLDVDRAPVAGVEVLAVPSGAGVRHMSGTQRRLRRRSRDDTFDGDPFDACGDVSGAAGDVRFSGLAFDEVELLSLDPGWAVVGPGVVDGAATQVEWTLESRVGVRVSVLDASEVPLMDRVRSTFRVDVTFEDGTTMDIGQWVGRGEGLISMSLSRADLGDIGGRAPRVVAFHGTATTETDAAEWRSGPIGLESGWQGVAEATAVLEGLGPAEASGDRADPAPEAALAELELDVTFTDGVPCAAPLEVSWSGAHGRGSVRARRSGPGRHVATLPAAVERVEVSRRSAQGSIAPWSGAVDLDASTRARATVTLRRGARVTLERPLGFDGQWYLHASWREGSEGAWRGSWTYGTQDDALDLEAIEPAEWRFTARRAAAPGEDDIVRTVELAEGGDERITW